MLEHSVIQPVDDLREEYEAAPCLNRRGFLKLAAFAMGGLLVTPAVAKVATAKERSLSFYNLHTGETVRTVYWVPQQGYIRQSITEISRVLRDHRNNLIKAIDPKLLDQMYALQLTLGAKKPIHVISGYRSPATNAMLRKHNKRVAEKSLHMQGKAVDIRIPGCDAADLRRAALSLKAGGVGYYPRSNFIHIDTGPVRSWG